MTFPVSPTNNQLATVNGITYVYTSATNSWARVTANSLTLSGNLTAGNVSGNKIYTTQGLFWSGNGVAFSSGGGGAGITYTSDVAPHGSPAIGDQWYDTSTDVLFEYIEDGTTSYWVDIQSPTTFSAVPTTLQGNISINGAFSVTSSATIAGNISTPSNVIVSGEITSANLVTSNVFVTGDIVSTANLVSGNVVTGIITATGEITAANLVTSNVFVTGDITSTGFITSANIVTANVYSTGDITADGSILTVANVISGNVETGIITATGDITTSGNVTAGLTVTSANIVTANVLSTGTITAVGNVISANIVLGNIFATGTTQTGNIITTSGIFWANGLNALSAAYGNTNVNQFLPTYVGNLSTGNITANTSTGNLSILGGNLVVNNGNLVVSDGNVFVNGAGNLTVKGNIVQQGNYYETFSNITNTGGNLTCNFVNGSIFNVTSISANVTANFTNINAISGAAIGATVIFNQGAIAYYIANVQINGVNQFVRWVNGQGTGTAPTGLANNNDIISFSMLHLGNGTYKIYGQLSSY